MPTDLVNRPVRVLYLVGPGRGGSTLFERLLNSSPQVLALGEFHCLWRLQPERIVCACGQPFADCGFWRGVMQRSGTGAPELARLRALEQQVARSGFIARQGFSLPKLTRHAGVAEYLALQRRVFDAVAAESGARWLIDSSKAGPRAWLMATETGTEVVHLHRDAVAVLSSWRQPKWDPSLNAPMHKPSVGAAALDWWKAEAWAASLARRRPVLRIDYEALVGQPRAVLAAALDAPAPGLVGSIGWMPDGRVLPSARYHSLNGNPDRFDAGPITISARRPALEKLDRQDRWAVRTVGGLLDRLYR